MLYRGFDKPYLPLMPFVLCGAIFLVHTIGAAKLEVFK